MNKHRSQIQFSGKLFLLLFLTVLGVLLSISVLDARPPMPGEESSPLIAAQSDRPVQQVDATVVKSTAIHSLERATRTIIEPKTSLSKANRQDFSRRFAGSVWMANASSEVDTNCTQLLGNSELTVTDGSFYPWFILDTGVYYTESTYTSAPHSVLMEAEDEGLIRDSDAFGQAVEMPAGNLVKVTVAFNTASVDSNLDDLQGGAIWTVDSEGYIDEYVTEWRIDDSENQWERRMVELIETDLLNQMENQEIVLIFFFKTNDQGLAETVLFDDITLTVCTDPNSSPEPLAFLPYVAYVQRPTATPEPTSTTTPPTTTPTSTPVPSNDIDGNWTGTTTQGRSLSFEIQNRTVTSVTFSVQLPNCTRSGTVKFAGGPVISGNMFEVSWGGHLPGEDKMTLEGQFGSDNSASGSLKNDGSNCGDFTVSWTASK